MAAKGEARTGGGGGGRAKKIVPRELEPVPPLVIRF